SRAQRYQVLLHVDAETLSVEGEQGRSELEDGTRVSAETSRRLACDASVVAIKHGTDGSVLRVGRRTRTISPALRRALEARDQGCRFPGCGLRFTDAHHVKHWADGGETALSNLLLLCAHHHRLVHEEGWKVEWWGGDQPAFVDSRGQIHVNGRGSAPQLPPDPVDFLIADTRRRGADPDFYTAGARWKREADIPDRVYSPAMEAVA
ncbi:MAG: HNH endonuclease, partial [Gemmatimonadales bacterium]